MLQKTTATFSQAYSQLNPAQKKAVDVIEGPVMVIAGPGTGKTQVLAARIANILLKTDSNPYNILALTFTDSAAKNMRERVVQMIGQAGYYVQITTFHSLCASILRSYPEYFPVDRSSKPLTDIERYSLIQTCITELPLEILKPLNRPLFYLREILKAISDLKREGISVERFSQIVEQDFAESPAKTKKSALLKFQKQQQKNQELVIVYQLYEEKLRSSLRYDFDDLISLVVAAFQAHPEFLQLYQEQFHYLLVDEYQDTNSAQTMIIQLLASYWGEQANVFVVGDPHQSIYRFQGASVENVYGFLNRYSQAKVVTLSQGYRCPQPIYSAAHQLIGNNTLTALANSADQKKLVVALAQELESQTKLKNSPVVFAAPSQLLELIQVAEEIQTLIKTGTQPEEIAVLYRTNAESTQIQSVLERWQIPYEIDGGSDVLQDPTVLQLLELFALIDDLRTGKDGHQLFEVLGYPWLGLDDTVVFKVARLAGQRKLSIYQVIKKGYDWLSGQHQDSGISQAKFQTLVNLVEKLENWAVLDSHVTFPEWFETLLKDSGLFKWITAQETKIELLLSFNALFAEIQSLARSNRSAKLATFLSTVAVMREHGIHLEPEDLNIKTGAVQLATVHKAKGREWQYVFIVHCLDGRWGNRRSVELIPLPPSILRFTDISAKERNEDERRLFYVALTRAKQQVFCSYPESLVLENRTQAVVASMFLAEIDQHIQIKPTQELSFVQKEEEYLEKLLVNTHSRYAQVNDAVFFKHAVDSLRLSITAINEYLRDKDGFIKRRLLRVPESTPAFLAYGTAVHSSLEKLNSYYQKNRRYFSLEQFLTAFEVALSKELLTDDELVRRLKHGRQILAEYYQYATPQPANPLMVEKFFGSGFAETRLGDIALSGRVDRIDILDAEKKLVQVIDYKTGQQKTSNEIEGKTVSAGLSARERSLPEPIRGPYKRQLLFYKLLTELDKSFNFTVTHGVFEFVEPTKTGNQFVRREFELLQTDVDLLKELIIQIMAELRELKFLE